MVSTAGGSTSEDVTKFIVPSCKEGMKPYVGKVFENLKEAEVFYKDYASDCGFEVRKATTVKSKDKNIIWRYVVCNKEGSKNVANKVLSGNKKRRRMDTRTGCKARVVIRLEGCVGYVVTGFIEAHNHDMISEAYKHLMNSCRKVTPAHKLMIGKCRRANIGPMRSFRFFKELVGTYEDIGCTTIEFKNYARDMRAFANGVDAEILLQKLESKRDFCAGFTFDVAEDEWHQVKCLFWADPLSIQNYQIFGEAVSFDATYSTNRYKMIFTPFTGRDNHGRCVTFGVGLLTREDYESYVWILSRFADCMKRHPKMLITDEDPAMKKAVAEVFPDTLHRLCMWHIMRKVAEKVPKILNEDSEFKNKLFSLVWSEMYDPIEFEERWHNVMNEYGLCDHKWFCKLFSMRSSWIPSYFRELEMSGLFKTTSLSESENSFFRQYLNKHHDLAEFYIHFGSAIDAQRNSHDKLCYKDQTGLPVLKTHFAIELQAATVYTLSMFLKVQREILAAVHECRISSMVHKDDTSIYHVVANDELKFEVTYLIAEESFSCSCKYYTRKGLLCRHIFVMMFNMNVTSIPQKYICHRWTKVASAEIADKRANSGYSHPSCNNELFIEACKCIGLVDGDPERRVQFLQILKDASAKFSSKKDQNAEQKDIEGNDAMFEQYYGLPKPKTCRLLAPEVCSTKGGAVRLKSHREKAIAAAVAANKPLRGCRTCKTKTNHDTRNCPSKILGRG